MMKGGKSQARGSRLQRCAVGTQSFRTSERSAPQGAKNTMAAIDAFDYKEPACPLCSGKDFYYPDPEAPDGHIPVANITEKLDSLLAREDYDGAKRLLKYWIDEAAALKDKRGELSVQSEIMGLARKTNDRGWGMAAVERGLELIDTLGLGQLVSAATILLNAATTCKAFGDPERALTLYARAEAVYEKELPENDLQLAGLYNNKATALAELERFDEAEALYERAYAILEHNGHTKPDRAVTKINLADLYAAAGRDEAQVEALLFEALALLDDEHTVRDGYYAFVCRKAAQAFGYYGFFKVRKDLDERADRIYAGA